MNTYHIRIARRRIADDDAIRVVGWSYRVLDPQGVEHNGGAITRYGAKAKAERLARRLARSTRNEKPSVYEYRPGEL